MKISTFRAVFALIGGGISGLVKYLINIFNDQVLSRITDKETGLKYLRDVQAIYSLCNSILTNHEKDFSEKKLEAAKAVLAAMEELTKALEDFKVEEAELDGIIAKINAAIDAWKAAK